MGFFDDDAGAEAQIRTAQMQIAAEERAREQAIAREEQLKAEKRAANQKLRTDSSAAARAAANRYFETLGYDPNQFSSDVDTRINEILGSTAEDDPNVGQYFKDIGDSIFQSRQTGARSQANRSLANTFGPDYEFQRVGDELDDSVIGDIYGEQRSKADSYIQNLFKRGVIGAKGVEGATADLDKQGSKVRATLNDIGGGILSKGRQNITDILNRARTSASTMPFGTNFNVGDYANQINRNYDQFVSTLGDQFRSKLPSDNLFDTKGLASIAGATQGAGNFKFDPKALAGVVGQDDEEQQRNAAISRVNF
jgi:hypothetical protein